MVTVKLNLMCDPKMAILSESHGIFLIDTIYMCVCVYIEREKEREGNGTLTQVFLDRGAWRAIVHGVAKSRI